MPNIAPNIVPIFLSLIRKYVAIKFVSPFTISNEIPENMLFLISTLLNGN